MFRQVRRLMLGLLLLVFGVAAGLAQSVRGAITGNVQDASGDKIVGAQVELRSPTQGTVFTTTTNNAGIYRFDAVWVGDYVVTVNAHGFAKMAQNANVTVGALVGRDFVLSISSESSTVEITTTPPDIQTDDAVRSHVVQAEALAQLPISGLNSLNLMLTAPGVVRSNLGGSLDSGIGSVNGARARSNNFLLDGINNNDISVMGPQFSLYNNDALQEVSFQTSNFTAEYGRAGGVIVSQVTKSGTNSLHGTLGETYISQVFNASTNTQRIAYNAQTIKTNPLKPKSKENIPTFTIGGPVLIPHLYDGRNRTFFFAQGSWDRYSSGGSAGTFTVPTAAGYATLNALASSCSNVAAYLSSLGVARGIANVTSVPIDVQADLASTTCNGSTRAGQNVDIGTYYRYVPEVSLDNNHLVKIDHIVSNKQNMMFRWIKDVSSDNIGGQVGVNSIYDIPYTQKYLSGNFNHNYAFTPRTLNEFRFGFSRAVIGYYTTNPQALALPAISPGNGLTALQLSSTFPQGRTSNTWQYEDVVTMVRGRHTFKVGAQILRQLAVQDAPYNSRGTVTYAAVAANAAGAITNPIQALANFIDNYGGTGASATISFGTGHYRPNLFTQSYYAQDTFKMTPSLTLTYGVRYENFGQPANLFPYPAYGGLSTTGYADNSRVVKDNNNFGPSVGFSWSPNYYGRPGAFVLRGGYQITYDTFYNNLLSNMAAGAPNTGASAAIVSASNATTRRGYVGFSNVLGSLTQVPFNPYTSFASQFKKDMRNPYYHHFSLGVQQDIGGGVVLDIAYVGSLGRQLFFSNNVNPILPDSTRSTYAQQSTAYGTQYTRLASNRGSVTTRESGLTSSYHSLQVQLRRRSWQTPAGRLNFTESYTWSKNMDILSEVFGTYASGAYMSKSISQYGPAKNFDHGPSDNDRRHVSSTMLVMDFRGTKNGFLNRVVGGWSLANILTLMSGQPYNVFNGTDRDLDGASTNDRPNYGNMNAPKNTRAVITSTANCASGYWDPNKRTSTSAAISTACTTVGASRFVQAPVYDPINPNMVKRNSQYTSRYLRLDTDIIKKIAITNRVKMELRGEIFNITNNQNFDSPTALETTSSTSNLFDNYSQLNGGGRTMRVGGKILF